MNRQAAHQSILTKMTSEQTKSDHSLILHTSGSTALPKPIFINHGWPAACDAQNLIPDEMNDGRPIRRFKDSFGNAMKMIRDFAPFPPFHVIGNLAVMVRTVFCNRVLIFGPRDRIATPQAAP